MEFIWHDGGRAASGYVGLAGDCVTRSISIATGLAYRDVYQSLGEVSGKTPRNGVYTQHAAGYLNDRGWERRHGKGLAFQPESLPRGVVVCHLSTASDRGHHFCTVVDHVVYDTWDPSDDGDYLVQDYWVMPAGDANTTLPGQAAKVRVDKEQEMNQQEFDRILHRLRSLDSTASNAASTEGEKRNALRMMQTLMLRHHLSRDDISEDDSVDNVQFTRMTCYVNGKRGCSWEKGLAMYVVGEVLTTVQCYTSTRSKRTCVCFYGPKSDVGNCVSLFRELLVTIAASARLRYGGYARGSGASYAEGYVQGLPRSGSTAADDNDHDHDGDASQAAGRGPEDSSGGTTAAQQALIQTRTIAVQSAALDWLASECNIRLRSTSGYGRSQHDEAAATQGRRDGAKQQVAAPGSPKRITKQ